MIISTRRSIAESLSSRSQASLRLRPAAAKVTYDALIIGGGPAGYAAALALHHNGYNRIHIVEKNESPDHVDPSKVTAYLLSWAGKAAMRSLGMHDIEARGKTRAGQWTRRTLSASGKGRVQKVGPKGPLPPDLAPTLFSRPGLMRFLHSSAERVCGSGLEIVYGARVGRVHVPSSTSSDPRPAIAVTYRGGLEVIVTCNLLVAADGARSIVRHALQQAVPGGGFGLRTYHPPSAGFAFKTMPIPEDATFVQGEVPVTESSQAFYRAQRVVRDPLIHFTVFEGDAGLQCTFAMRADHPFWALRDADDFYGYMERAVPQCTNLRTAMPRAAVETFLSARGDTFPATQHAGRLVHVCGKSTGIVLMGDAAHAFPPDRAQGVNIALMDGQGLCEALQEHPHNLCAALQAFEEARLPEARGICELMKFGSPLQYTSLGTKLQRGLWTAALLRETLCWKLLPFIFSPPATLQLIYKVGLEGRLSYAKVAASHRANQAKLAVASSVFLAALVAGILRLVGCL